MTDEVTPPPENPTPAGQTPPAGAAGKPAEGAQPPAAGKAPPAEGAKPASAASKGEQDVKPMWPENWRETFARGDASRKALLDRLSSPEAAIDKLFEQEKVIRGGQKPEPFPEKGTPEQQAKWRAANGVPEAADKYDLKLNEGLIVGEADKPVLDAFLAKAHTRNMPTKAVNEAVNAYFEVREAERLQLEEADAQHQFDSRQLLMQEYGGEYKMNVSALKNYLEGLPDGVGELLINGRTADGKVIGNDARVMRFLIDIARQQNPAATVIQGGNEASLSAELATIEKTMRDNPDAYWKDTAMQARYGQLLSAKTQMDGKTR